MRNGLKEMEGIHYTHLEGINVLLKSENRVQLYIFMTFLDKILYRLLYVKNLYALMN